MSENANSSNMSKLVYVIIALVAIIGLLAGLLISKIASPEPVMTTTQVQTDVPSETGTVPTTRPPSNTDTTPQDVRRIVRNLSRERRRAVLQQAMQNIEKSGYERPRILIQKRQKARRKTLEIASSEPFDADAMRKALEDVHKINEEMVKQGTELTVEVLQLMTPEERKKATQRDPRSRRERVRERRKQRNQNRP